MVPDAFELQEKRAGVRQPGGRPEPVSGLDRLRVREAVRDMVGCAGAPDKADRLPGVDSFGRLLQTAMFVEEPQVEVQNALADEVEAKVTAFDYAGVNRADSNVVWPCP